MDKYQKTVLNNGIRIVSEKIPYVKSVAIGIWVGAGSRLENETQNGISHFIEHLYFKGTEKRTAKDIAEDLDAIGGQLNAFTSKEHTCYYARVLDEHLDLALDVLADMFFYSKFEEKEINKEREVIKEEIKMYEDTPDELIHDIFSQTIWGNHPLGRPVLGTEDSISILNRESILQYIGENYTTDNIVIALAGNIDHQRILPKLKKLFGAKESKTLTKKIGPPEHRTQIFNLYRETAQVQICLGVAGLAQEDPEIYALYILNSILGGGLSSRLVQEIRELRGLAYSVYSYHLSFHDTGLFTFYAGTSPENYEQVVSLITQEATQISKLGISAQELLKAKEQLKGNLYLGLESVGSRMTRLGRNEISLNKYIPPEEVVQKITSVEKDQVQELAKRLFGNGDFTIATIGPIRNKKF